MNSFEDFGVAPELVEALTSEGIEVPTPLQEAAVPLLRNGNNLVLAAGPGSGLLAAWAVPLLDRFPAEEAGTRVLVLAAVREAAALACAQMFGRGVSGDGSLEALNGVVGSDAALNVRGAAAAALGRLKLDPAMRTHLLELVRVNVGE